MAATTIKESCSLIPLVRTPDHPPYAEMIGNAITSLREECGSSEASISKIIRSNYLDLPPAHNNLLSYHLSKLTRLGEIHQLGPDSFTLPTVQDPDPKPILSLPPKRRPAPKHQPIAEPTLLLAGSPDQSAGHRSDGRDPDPEERSSEPVRKKQGRQRKQSPEQRTDDRAPDAEERSGEPVRKKQGRPPKQSPGKRTDDRAPDPEERSSEPVGRKRGRPRKVEGAKRPLSAAVKGGDGFAPRGRGRPPKKAKIAEAAPVVME